MKKLLGSLIIIFAGVILFAPTHALAAAFGVSPPWVKNNHLLPGATSKEVIYLSRNEPEEEMKVAVRISGDEDLVGWIQIQNEENLIMKKGQTLLPMKIIVEVPEHATLKKYTGSIFVTLSPIVADTSLEGGEVAIGLGARIAVNISVIGDKITDYEVTSVTVEPQEEDDPFSINVEVENKGNTEISDLKGQIDIYNSINTEILKSLTFIPFDEPVSPDETKKVEMIYQDYIPDPGEYWVAVKTFKDEEVIYESRFLQKVKGEVVPIITPEGIDEETAVTPPAVQVPVSDVKSSAPAVAEAKNVYLILGLAGFGLGLVALIGIIAILVLKKRAKESSLDEL